MRFSTAQFVVLASASYVLAAPAGPADGPLSPGALTGPGPKPQGKLRIDTTADPRQRKSELASPGLGSPYGPLSPHQRKHHHGLSPLPSAKESHAFRKHLRHYCAQEHHNPLICSKKPTHTIMTKALKGKVSKPMEKKLENLLNMARAYVEEHGSRTSKNLKRHKLYRKQRLAKLKAVEDEADAVPKTPKTPKTPATPATPLSPSLKSTKSKMLARRAIEEGAATTETPAPAPAPRRRHRNHKNKNRRKYRKCRKFPVGPEREACKQQVYEANGGVGPRPHGHHGRHQPAAAAVTTPTEAVTTPTEVTPAVQQVARRSFEDEFMELERRFLAGELDELD